MTREERCLLAIEKGYTYNPETGKVYSKFNREITKHTNMGYIILQLKLNNKAYGLLSHQFAWYVTHKEIVEEIDHINGQRDDNRIYNLRSVNHQSNSWNNTKAKGYSWCKRDKRFITSIKVNGKNICLGRYNTEAEAKEAYIKEKYHNIQ